MRTSDGRKWARRMHIVVVVVGQVHGYPRINLYVMACAANVPGTCLTPIPPLTFRPRQGDRDTGCGEIRTSLRAVE